MFICSCAQISHSFYWCSPKIQNSVKDSANKIESLVHEVEKNPNTKLANKRRREANREVAKQREQERGGEGKGEEDKMREGERTGQAAEGNLDRKSVV